MFVRGTIPRFALDLEALELSHATSLYANSAPRIAAYRKGFRKSAFTSQM